ncbi:uncharacterized protein LTR77_006832 [Saxophila tyrrhenica]|uniref:Uncharacterized protein n=1 Tax=Saxophila tyrrhenica TaxID=1690608 RepID=A0AAV9P9Q6_9PEZI|nr:hypothetical protein LTR77_006832 [Saxophila tyrrhenica]
MLNTATDTPKLLTLPGELRNAIYELVVQDAKATFTQDAKLILTSPFACVNRQIRQEYLSILKTQFPVLTTDVVHFKFDHIYKYYLEHHDIGPHASSATLPGVQIAMHIKPGNPKRVRFGLDEWLGRRTGLYLGCTTSVKASYTITGDTVGAEERAASDQNGRFRWHLQYIMEALGWVESKRWRKVWASHEAHREKSDGRKVYEMMGGSI